MKDQILIHLNDPRHLEQIYRADKTRFHREFNNIYPELRGNSLADFWYERLNYEKDDISWGTKQEIIFVVIASLLAGLIAKIPEFTNLDADYFYPRNIGFVVFPFLTAYFAWKQKAPGKKLVIAAVAFLISAIYINMLPGNEESDTLILACMHLLLILWAALGFIFVGNELNNTGEWLDFLRYNGDLVVISALILIAGGILSGITIGLFSLIGFNIEEFYMQYVAIFGLAAVPIVGTYLTRTNPQLVGKVSPVIAKIFSPLVLLMLVIYLGATIYSGKDPYNDREFLLVFNALLIGVLAIIFFSVAETSGKTRSRAEIWVLLLLSIVTVVVNGIALSAILFRISEWGITPNRAAVLGGNLLILINLLLVTAQLFKLTSKKGDTTRVGRAIVSYLPIYILWAIIVTFIFPLVFGFE